MKHLIYAKLKLKSCFEQITKNEDGLATIEYAIVMVAAATLAGILIMIVKSDAVKLAIQNIVTNALTVQK